MTNEASSAMRAAPSSSQAGRADHQVGGQRDAPVHPIREQTHQDLPDEICDEVDVDAQRLERAAAQPRRRH